MLPSVLLSVSLFLQPQRKYVSHKTFTKTHTYTHAHFFSLIKHWISLSTGLLIKLHNLILSKHKSSHHKSMTKLARRMNDPQTHQTHRHTKTVKTAFIYIHRAKRRHTGRNHNISLVSLAFWCVSPIRFHSFFFLV